MKNETLYILEKIWKIDKKDFKFDKDKFDCVLVRPCNVSYRTYRNFSLGKKVKVKTIIHEGCVASWSADKSFAYCTGAPDNFDQFIIETNVNRQVFPLIENWVFEQNWKSYTVKTIDLKTNEVLFDATNKWLSENKPYYLI